MRNAEASPGARLEVAVFMARVNPRFQSQKTEKLISGSNRPSNPPFHYTKQLHGLKALYDERLVWQRPVILAREVVRASCS